MTSHHWVLSICAIHFIWMWIVLSGTWMSPIRFARNAPNRMTLERFLFCPTKALEKLLTNHSNKGNYFDGKENGKLNWNGMRQLCLMSLREICFGVTDLNWGWTHVDVSRSDWARSPTRRCDVKILLQMNWSEHDRHVNYVNALRLSTYCELCHVTLRYL